MPTPELNAIIEDRVLDETEQALNEFVTAALNVGVRKMQMAIMLQKKVDELAPPSIISVPNATVQ